MQNNMSLSKTMQLGETRSLEIRATINNVFNTVQYAGVDTNVASPTFGQVTSAGSMRSFPIHFEVQVLMANWIEKAVAIVSAFALALPAAPIGAAQDAEPCAAEQLCIQGQCRAGADERGGARRQDR